MTPIKWLIIGWLIQSILLLYLFYDVHTRLDFQRKYMASLGTLLGIDIDKVLALMDKADEIARNEE